MKKLSDLFKGKQRRELERARKELEDAAQKTKDMHETYGRVHLAKEVIPFLKKLGLIIDEMGDDTPQTKLELINLREELADFLKSEIGSAAMKADSQHNEPPSPK